MADQLSDCPHCATRGDLVPTPEALADLERIVAECRLVCLEGMADEKIIASMAGDDRPIIYADTETVTAALERIMAEDGAALALLAGRGPVCLVCHRVLGSPYEHDDAAEAEHQAGVCRRCWSEIGP